MVRGFFLKKILSLNHYFLTRTFHALKRKDRNPFINKLLQLTQGTLYWIEAAIDQDGCKSTWGTSVLRSQAVQQM